MYVAIDINRTDSILHRINMLNRKFAGIHEQYLYLSRQIDMEVRNKEAVLTALRRLERDMDSAGRAIEKLEDILEQILEEYRAAARLNLRDVEALTGAVGVAFTNNTVVYPSDHQTFNEYILNINNRLGIPVGLSVLLDPGALEENGFSVSEAEIKGNIPVLTWESPLF